MSQGFRVFCPSITAAKRNQAYHFGDKDFFSGEGCPAPSTTFHSLRRQRRTAPPYWNPKYSTDGLWLKHDSHPIHLGVIEDHNLPCREHLLSWRAITTLCRAAHWSRSRSSLWSKARRKTSNDCILLNYFTHKTEHYTFRQHELKQTEDMPVSHKFRLSKL